MSSILLPRTVAAVTSSRSTLAVAAAGRHVLLHQQQQQQSAASRGLAYRSSGSGTSFKEQLQSPVQPQNHKQPELHQSDPHHAHHRHPQHHQQQTRRPSTSQAAQRAGAAESTHNGDYAAVDNAVQYSVTAAQQLREAGGEHHQEWARSQSLPEIRLRKAVERFGERYFADELLCRTRKSVAGAAAAGKGYITAEDITRVLETISDGTYTITEEEAEGICEAWGTRRSAREGGGGKADGGVSDCDTAAAAAVGHHVDEGSVVSVVSGGSGGGGGVSAPRAQAGEAKSLGEGPSAPMPTIPKDVFLQLLKPSSEL